MKLALNLKNCMVENGKDYYQKHNFNNKLAFYEEKTNTLYFNTCIYPKGKPNRRLVAAYYEIKGRHKDAKISEFAQVNLGWKF